jgi:hypothetical protein
VLPSTSLQKSFLLIKPLSARALYDQILCWLRGVGLSPVPMTITGPAGARRI